MWHWVRWTHPMPHWGARATPGDGRSDGRNSATSCGGERGCGVRTDPPVIAVLSGVARRLEVVTDAPLSGLLHAILPDPALRGVVERAGAPLLELQGPVAARQLVVAALAADAGARRPVLAVTATGREADELTAALEALLGKDKVADFPSWETLPHERLSPRADTVGRRLEVLHRLKTEDDGLRVVVATVRSLIQPMAPGLGSL